MKLNVKDLRIANLLFYNGVIKEISSLHSDNTLRFKEGKNTIGCFKATIEAIKPIPLIEEILLKCGFEKDLSDLKLILNKARLEFIFYGGLSHQLDIIQDGKHLFMFSGCCVYLHQLQNLYFALTNEELIINLKTD